jgi:hypothetical protein
MTDADLLSAIEADPTVKALADAGNDAGCAARLAAVLPPAVRSTYVNERAIFAAFPNPADAEAFMQGLEAVAAGQPNATPPVPGNPIVKRALDWLAPNNGGVDVGNPAVRVMLDRMAAGGAITTAAAATVKALAQSPASVSAADVSRVLAPGRGL